MHCVAAWIIHCAQDVTFHWCWRRDVPLCWRRDVPLVLRCWTWNTTHFLKQFVQISKGPCQLPLSLGPCVAWHPVWRNVFLAGPHLVRSRLSYSVASICRLSIRNVLWLNGEKSIGTKMNDLDLCLEVVSSSCQRLRYIRRWIARKPLEIDCNFWHRGTLTLSAGLVNPKDHR